jgi:hypothetical protein
MPKSTLMEIDCAAKLLRDAGWIVMPPSATTGPYDKVALCDRIPYFLVTGPYRPDLVQRALEESKSWEPHR